MNDALNEKARDFARVTSIMSRRASSCKHLTLGDVEFSTDIRNRRLRDGNLLTQSFKRYVVRFSENSHAQIKSGGQAKTEAEMRHPHAATSRPPTHQTST